jgi:hypothetical protein
VRRLLGPGALLCGVLGVLAGCGLKGITRPVGVPHTVVFIQGPVDPVNHVVHLYWFGSDPSGYIAGYEFRLLNPAAPADSAWIFTTRTDTILTVFTPNGATTAVFEVRAINDRGVRDPHPAVETFQFKNTPPIVKFAGKPNAADHSDTTFASATVDWTVSDPDGDPTKVIYRIWLNGQAAQITTATGMTLLSSQFLENGAYRSGFRTLYIQGIDDGGMAGPIDSVRWYVRAPVTGTRARLLLIEDVDDVPTISKLSPPARLRTDTLYANAIARSAVAANQWSMLRLDISHPFRSAKDLEQTLKLFEAVVWYRSEQTLFSNTLSKYGDGIGPYLDAGGKIFIESLNLTTAQSTAGGLSQDFADHYLETYGVAQFPQPPDSSASWTISTTVVLTSPALNDSVLNTRSDVGLRGFRNFNPSQILLLLPAHAASPDNSIALPVGLDVPQAMGGRFMVDTYPLLSASIADTGFPQRASEFLSKILARLGLASP